MPAAGLTFLFINVSRIGDTLFATPAMRAVAGAYPGSRIAVLGHPKRTEILRGLPFAAEVGSITKRSAPWRGRLGGRHWDYAFVYGFDEPLVRYALRVSDRTVAFRQKSEDLNRRLYRCVDPPPFQSEHSVLQCLRLPAAMGVPPAGMRPAYQVSPQEVVAARERLAADVPRTASPLIGFQVASFPTKAYRDWPIGHFAELADRIVADWPLSHFLLFGGGEERSRVSWLKDRLGDRATLYAGLLTLRETAALMACTDLYVGVDTGPTHLMSTFDIPLVGLYHCISSSKLTGPADHPCFYAVDHPRAREQCNERTEMAEISVESVLLQVRQALTEHPPARAAQAAARLA
ncbi:MAG: glycosyltransferase family 9 protein [Burkholderiales bacterium]